MVNGEVSPATDNARRSLVHITVPTPRLGRLTVEKLQSGEDNFLYRAIEPLERPGVYAVAENVGIHFVSGFLGNNVPSGMSNYLGPFMLKELVYAPALSQETR